MSLQPYRMRLLAGSIAVALLHGVQWIPAGAADGIQEAGMEEAKRRAPAVKPVNHAGIRYEVASGRRARTTGQASGVLAATEISSGKELWTRAVYKVSYESAEESDAQDVFIVKLALNKAKDGLVVEDEQGRHFTVRLSDGEAEEVKP